jgi:hypothetical protein
MKRIQKVLATLSLLALLGACGGGDEDIGNAVPLNVQPSEFTFLEACPGGAAVGRVSTHIINGGFGPFRIKPTGLGLEVGFVSGGSFVPATPSQVNDEGFLEVDGQDPSFAVRTIVLGCGSDVGVIVLDSRSTAVSVSIKVDAAPE